MAQFIESERGNILLVLENFKFSKVNRPLASGLTKFMVAVFIYYNRGIGMFKQYGISVEYKTEASTIRNRIVKCFGLVFLEPEMVFDYFEVFLMSPKPL